MPLAREESVRRVPKDESTVISVFNYENLGYTATLKTTKQGSIMLDKKPDAFILIDQAILALSLDTPKDARKLLHLPQLKAIHARPQARAHRLYKQGLLDIVFSRIEVIV